MSSAMSEAAAFCPTARSAAACKAGIRVEAPAGVGGPDRADDGDGEAGAVEGGAEPTTASGRGPVDVGAASGDSFDSFESPETSPHPAVSTAAKATDTAPPNTRFARFFQDFIASDRTSPCSTGARPVPDLCSTVVRAIGPHGGCGAQPNRRVAMMSKIHIVLVSI
ncbi:hypothetical protein OG216_02220 [Streptomycetaceae bacterium NBC_01309]